jgi:hypothetical protein
LFYHLHSLRSHLDVEFLSGRTEPTDLWFIQNSAVATDTVLLCSNRRTRQ